MSSKFLKTFMHLSNRSLFYFISFKIYRFIRYKIKMGQNSISNKFINFRKGQINLVDLLKIIKNSRHVRHFEN